MFLAVDCRGALRERRRPAAAPMADATTTRYVPTSGWLRKRGGGHRSAAYRRRYFIVSGGVVRWYKSVPRQPNEAAQGAFDVSGASVERTGRVELEVALPAHQRTLHLRVDGDEAEVQRWLRAFRAAASGAAGAVIISKTPGVADSEGEDRDGDGDGDGGALSAPQSAPGGSADIDDRDQEWCGHVRHLCMERQLTRRMRTALGGIAEFVDVRAH